MKQNSENWQHSFNHNEMILQSVGEGICVIDKHGNISFANLSAAKMLGWIADDLIGKCYKEALFGSADANSADEFYAKSSPVEFTLTEGETVHINTETFFCQSAENFLVEYIAVPLLENDEIVGAVITFQDITERREIEVALAEARDAALESAKVKAGFLANMSHEIRTPLNGITGIIELLADTPLSAEQGDYVQIIQKSADLLLNIVNDILDFSRIEAKMLQLEVINFDLNQTVLDTMKLFAAKANKKGISLEVEMDRDVEHVVHGDVGRFRQILNNLVGAGKEPLLIRSCKSANSDCFTLSMCACISSAVGSFFFFI